VNCLSWGSRNSLVLWYKILKGERPTGYGDSFVVARRPFRVARVVWGTELLFAEGLAWVGRQHELCQPQLKTWHLSYGDLSK